MLSQIRRFFAKREVVEVETPSLCRTVGTDPHLSFFSTCLNEPGGRPGETLYLQTSPEFAMKRLLAAGSGPIYQICKAFRNEETGRFHNPEFTILEWYRPGFVLDRLMDEIEALMRALLAGTPHDGKGDRLSYREAFINHADIDPLTASIGDFVCCAHTNGLGDARSLCGKVASHWLDFLFSHLVQPELGFGGPCFLFDFPACQAALARIRPGPPAVAERVEIFVRGIELANGFHELTDPCEQEQRFEQEQRERARTGRPVPAKDTRFLDALKAGLPDCSGVAVGLDRLLMLITGADRIDDVLTFPIARA
jgi:elongation factor P--(R)-beta-lysine ligase